MDSLWPWIIFNLFVLIMLALDLGVFHKTPHEIKFKEAILWSCIWVGMALIFNLGIFVIKGSGPAMEFFTGYIIEKALSVDNIFVILLIFSSFKVAPLYQHKILFWGVLGAIVMRAAFIFAGVALIKRFHWIIFVFGAFLVFTGVKILFHKNEEMHPENNIVLKFFKRFFPFTHELAGGSFFIKRSIGLQQRTFATPLFLVLILIETTDLIFAMDSIPAILAITPDPFIVYTSNIFAIMGLRSMFIALSGLVAKFSYLHFALSAILTFVGVKMLVTDIYAIPIGPSLLVVLAILVVAIVASIAKNRSQQSS